MKIGIIVYSQTGNTLSVAKRIEEELKKFKISTTIERVEATRNKSNNFDFTLNKEPDVSKYDAIIFCSYVEAFCLCPVMKKYMENVKALNDKKVLCFVTEKLPYPIMGGNRALRQMEKIIKEKGSNITLKGVINWDNKNREKKIQHLVLKFKEVLK